MYEGDWSRGMADGIGTMNYDDGSCYTGQWVKDCPHGRGCEILTNGRVYKGEFKNGHKEGPGSIMNKDGTEYRGKFQRNKLHGTCYVTTTDGSKRVAKFDEGVEIKKGVVADTQSWSSEENKKYDVANVLKENAEPTATDISTAAAKKGDKPAAHLDLSNLKEID